MEIIDVSAWPVIRPEERGQDEDKIWITQQGDLPREHWWLWKPCLSTGGGDHLRLNDMAEVLASELAGAIGLPAAECRLAHRGGEPGVISRSIAPQLVELTHGGVEVYAVSSEYSLDAVDEVLRDVQGPETCDPMTAFEVFAGYLVLDAWIANTDRHGENWGILEWSDGRRRLAPSFDHGSAVGSGMTDVNRETASVEKFCRKGKTRHFAGGASLLRLASQAVAMSGATWWPERVANVQPQVWRSILEETETVSEVAGRFIDGVLTTNQERVGSICRY